MKFLFQLLTTLLLCFGLQYFFPWWTMAIGAFGAGAYFGNKPLISFLAGFAGSAILWLGMAYSMDAATQSILAEKISKLLPLNAFIMTSLVGGLVGGFAALTGALVKSEKLKVKN